jgi:hypothetical protein
MSRNAMQPVPAWRRGLGYLMLILFAAMLLSLLYFGCKFLVLAIFDTKLSAKVRVLMIAAAAFALYTPLRVGLGMLQNRRRR